MDLSKILLDISLPTDKVAPESIQAVVSGAKKLSSTSESNQQVWENIIDTIWIHLNTGFEKLDDQLRCATCLYSVLHLSEKQRHYLKEIETLIKEEIKNRENDVIKVESANTEKNVSLMYGIFQSSYLLQQDISENNCLTLLQAMFTLLTEMAYDYSKITGVVFHTLCSLKKICGTHWEKHLLNKGNQIILLNLVNHNWENPLTGIRDMNKEVFQTLLSVIDEEMYRDILQQINSFYWNKAKYIMLAEIIKHSNKNIIEMVEDNHWINNLICSLSKPGLVSAGADMYFEILKKLKSENEWSKLFMKPIIDSLNISSHKAIENFSNYWCLTTFKTYPSLADTIINEIENFEDSEQKIYSCLLVAKQANRLGLIKKKTSIDYSTFLGNTVLMGLEHCNNQIRLLAFEILCISQKKIVRDKKEYEMVLEFLNNNVSSDCTVLRISMLNSFTAFITELHMSYVNNFEKIQDTDKENMKDFCCKLQHSIGESLDIGGNYQRRITCIKLLLIFLNELTTIRRTKSSHKPIIQMLTEEGCWFMFEGNLISRLIKFLKDPANDVREFVTNLLLSHYSKHIIQTNIMNTLIDDALKCMKSKFFYEISCGQSMFKLILKIMVQENVDATFNNVEDVYYFAFNELITEYKKGTSILESIEKGKQLHSFISILYVVFQVCLENDYKIAFSDDTMSELLEVLDSVSNQFAWEQQTSTSSDFAKMSDMIQNLIETSGYGSGDQNDETKISGLQQIVLNCLWLNVKSSCELLSVLTKHQKDDSGIKKCRKALHIISHVLETCRHKGAIEAAGVAFGQCIQHLTSFSKNEISELPLTFLEDKLNELIHEAVRMASITRRGAGLSIMVHRIVSGDVKRHKPLFHYFMKIILEICNKTDAIPGHVVNSENIDNEKDLPKAIYIHFLAKIVTDSSLASHMMFYSARLAELAFGNLTSSYWQIRNAALQLYGALVQKLIGQKKAAGTNEEAIATVAYDELRTHSSNLWRYILKQLQNNTYDDKVQYHSNLVPILNMLANTAKRYNFKYNIEEHKETEKDLLNNLIQLLDSPIYTVRRLTAKCIYNIYDFDMIFERLLTERFTTENYLHGSLLLVSNYNNEFKQNKKYTQQFYDLRIKFETVLNAKSHSYLSKQMFDEIFPEGLTESQTKQALLQLKTNTKVPGAFLWAKNRIEREIMTSSWAEIPGLIDLVISHSSAFEEICDLLLLKIEDDKTLLSKHIALELTNVLLKYDNKFNCSTIWKILYLLCCKTNLHRDEAGVMISENILKYFGNEDVSYKLRYMVPFTVRILALCGDKNNNITHIAKLIASLTDPDRDVEMRYIAAMANIELCGVFKSLTEECKIEVIKSNIILLQDEEEDVRIISAKFYPEVTNVKTSLQPYICLLRTLNHNFLKSVLSKNGIIKLCEALNLFIDKSLGKVIDEYNPFSNECSNIYIEMKLLRTLIKNLSA